MGSLNDPWSMEVLPRVLQLIVNKVYADVDCDRTVRPGSAIVAVVSARVSVFTGHHLSACVPGGKTDPRMAPSVHQMGVRRTILVFLRHQACGKIRRTRCPKEVCRDGPGAPEIRLEELGGRRGMYGLRMPIGRTAR